MGELGVVWQSSVEQGGFWHRCDSGLAWLSLGLLLNRWQVCPLCSPAPAYWVKNKINSNPWSFSSGPSLVFAQGSLCENVTAMCAAAEGSLGLRWLAQDCLIEVDCGDGPIFWKSSEPIYLFFLKHLLLSFGTTLSAGLQAKIRFGNSLVLAFLQAGVTVEAVASWNRGLQPEVFIAGALCL